MKKSMLKSLLFAMIGLFTFSQVQAEERVVATVNGTPILHIITMVFAWAAIIFCVVRAIPVVVESPKLFK